MRRLLLQAALGELGDDLSATADETLIATGLEGGDAEIAVTAEPEAESAAEPESTAPSPSTSSRARAAELRIEQLPPPRQPIEPTELERGDRHGAGDPHHGADPGRRRDQDHGDAVARRGLRRAPRRLARMAGRPSDRDIQHRERIDTPRVRHLFPVPEDADWEVVTELDYDRH